MATPTAKPTPPTVPLARVKHPESAAQQTPLRIAGLFLIAAGVIILMGIITGEATYPDTYTTFENEISDLGATRPPDSIIREPSATIFNVTMMLTGAMILAATAMLHRVFAARRVTISMALLGLGVLGVGVFPGNHATMHPIFALMAFLSGGVAAVLSAHVQAGAFRSVSWVLGGTTLISLLVGFSGQPSFAFDELGDGGVERWIAYPVVMWLAAFGGYLLASAEAERT